MSFHKAHNVKLGMEPRGRINADFEFSILHPLDESADPSFNLRAVLGVFKFGEYFPRDPFLRLGVGSQVELRLLLSTGKKRECRVVGFQTDQHPHLFSILHCLREAFEAAQVKVAN